MIDDLIESVRSWAGSGPQWQQWLKTALTHSLVLTLCVTAGALIGQAAITFGGLQPFFASAFPLIGFAEGWHFYRNRELHPETGDFFGADSWEGRVDSALDIIMPALVGPAEVFFVLFLYSLQGF